MLKNIGSNWILMMVSMAGAYLLLPFTLRHLGNDQYGTWLLITSFTGYLGLLVLGVPMASVRYITRELSRGDYREVNRTVAACAAMYLLIGLASLLVGLALLLFFERIYPLPESIRGAARIAYLVVVTGTSISFFAQLPHGIMAACHDFTGRNLVQTGSVIARIIATVLLLSFNPSLLVLALVQVVAVVVESAVLWALIAHRYPEVKLRLGWFEWKRIREIFSFSIFVLILNVGIQLSFQTDSLVIGKMLDIGQIPYYAVANTMMVYAMQFVIGIASVLMPVATRMYARAEHEELRRLFFKWSKITFSLTLLGSIDLIIFGPGLIRAWIGASYEKPSGAVLQVLMLSAFIFLPIRGVALPVLMGIGKPGRATIAFLVAGVMNLVLSILLAPLWGLVGVAVGTAIPNVFFGVVLLFICARELDFPVRRYLGRVAVAPLLAALPLTAILLWWQRFFHPASLPAILLAVVISCLAFALLWVGFVYRNDDDVDVRGFLTLCWERART